MSARSLSLLLLFLFLCFLPEGIQAQDQSDQLQYRKWRLTLFPPLSTNGTQAPNYTAKYSINILAGYHGGLDGSELGGLLNYNKYYAHGFQLAGGVNISGGDMAGVNLAGLANISKENMSGIQISGLTNYSGKDLEGIQLAGGLNYARNNSSGLQFSGLANIAEKDLEGLQGSSGINMAWGDISGLQVAGLANVAQNDVEGLQAAGLINFSGADLSGLQASGLANVAMGNIEGLMASGGVNVTNGTASGLLIAGVANFAATLEGASISGVANIANELNGLQWAGLINASQKARGLQIGLINIAKDFDGVPIGLFSYYGNGRKNIDMRISDTGFTDFSLTLGTHRVYNAAVFGYHGFLDRKVYRFGVAIGVEKNIQDAFTNWRDDRLYVNQEFSVLHHFEEEWNKDLNLIYSYKFLIGKRFGNGFSVYGGPSINAQVTRVATASDYTWYSLWSPERKGRQYRFWVGFTTGIRLFKQKAPELWSDEFDDWDIEW